ncbi:MAG TPA: SWIM zinc finger family protein [Acidobacteriaceae bacterium]|nr:SWIM zinc finger family protein [Acidobacteriaceae bacterium]
MTMPTHEPRGGPGKATPKRIRSIHASRGTRAREVNPRIHPEISEKPDPNTPPVPVPVSWGGHTVDAPGFNQDRFERAMARAFVDDLQLEPLGRGAFLAFQPGATRGQRVTRETCSCPAGQHDVPCKHRALVIAHLDIRMPQRARLVAKRRAAARRAAERQQAA